MDDLQLVPLGQADFVLREFVIIPETPMGTRMIAEVAQGTLEGDRLSAVMRPGSASGDWVTVDPRGVATLDVRLVWETHDGALVFSAYRGRGNVGEAVYAAPTYDTGDERYLWLNSIQAIAKGSLDGNQLHYDIYEVR